MPAREKPEDERREWRLQVPMNVAERAAFDALRGTMDGAVYARAKLLGCSPYALGTEPGVGTELALAQVPPATTQHDAPGEAIVDTTPPPPRESIILPPPANSTRESGWQYEQRSRTAGTLAIWQGEQRTEVDLVGVELEAMEDGRVEVTFADRSLVRVVKESPRAEQERIERALRLANWPGEEDMGK